MSACGDAWSNGAGPTRALILAAGQGRRLSPLTWLRPKALLPLWGVPLLEHTFRRLERWGVREAVVNAHALSGQVCDFVARRRGRLALAVATEPVLLGTGGALRPLRSVFGHAPFWIVNADILADCDPTALITRFRVGDVLASAWVSAERGPRTLRLSENGDIRSFTSGVPGQTDSATFCGLQLVSNRLFDSLPPAGACSMVTLYQRAMAAGERIAGVQLRGGRWDDAGSFARYLGLHTESPPATLCAAEATAAKATAGNCVVWPGGWIDGQHRSRGCVVTDGARLSGPWPHPVAVDAWQWPDAALLPVLAQAGWDGAQTVAAPLAARGSDRTFVRLGWGPRRAIFVRYGRNWAENRRYAGHARILEACGVRAPHLLADAPGVRALLLEDFGDRSLETVAARAPLAAEPAYGRVIRELANLHTRVTAWVHAQGVALEAPLDAKLFASEQALFRNGLLQQRYGRSPQAGVLAEWERVIARLGREPQVVVHRDLQSSNVLMLGVDVGVIDFQGMRLGPAAYDLASLLYDPYVTLPETLRTRLLERYRRAVSDRSNALRQALPWAAVQRLTQALGAYGRLGANPETARFARFIPVAAKRLEAVAAHIGLRAIAALARDLRAWERALHKGA